MQNINTDSEEENEYTVDYWRKRFKEVRSRLKKNWHQQLAAFDPAINTLQGANDMRAVSHSKASLQVTQRIVSIAEQLLKKPTKAKKRSNKTVEERLRLGW